MTWVIQYDGERKLVLVTAQGSLQHEPLRRMTADVRDAIRQHGAAGVLVDYRQTVSSLEPYEIFERPRILKEVGFPTTVKVAVLFRILDENTQFLENVYRNKNFPVRVFADESAAVTWLRERAS
jgi:hypothetical protein